ncbi:hypothetical protein GW17_00041363 [Ensete ventricosum]|nr:hypothetical protein GW17_00041363 [Ensete ventricosum]
MDLITHNMIYVCISASPCLVIVDLVIIGSVGLSHPCVVISRCHLHAPDAATPTAGGAAHAGDRAGRRRQPLVGALQLAPLRAPCCQRLPLAVPAGAAPCGLALATAGHPLAGDLGRGLAVDGQHYMGGWPWLADPTWWLVVVGHPSSLLHSLRRSYIPVFQIQMEKMKEVKRHPL